MDKVERIDPIALTPKQAAQMLRVSCRTLWSWTQAGRIPHRKEGRTVRYSVQALNEWLGGDKRAA